MKKLIKIIPIILIFIGIFFVKDSITAKKVENIKENKKEYNEVKIDTALINIESLINGTIKNEKTSVTNEIAGIIKFTKDWKVGDNFNKGDVAFSINHDDLLIEKKTIENNINLKEYEIEKSKIEVENKKQELKIYNVEENQYLTNEYNLNVLKIEKQKLYLELENINNKISKSIYEFPFDGIIYEKNVNNNEYVNNKEIFKIIPNNESLLEIQTSQKLPNKIDDFILYSVYPYLDSNFNNIYIYKTDRFIKDNEYINIKINNNIKAKKIPKNLTKGSKVILKINNECLESYFNIINEDENFYYVNDIDSISNICVEKEIGEKI